MKKNIFPHVTYAAALSLSGVICPLQAQVGSPAEWNRFVSSPQNPTVSDTFRLQTSGKSEWDNWFYQADGDVSSADGKHTLRIPEGDSVVFTPFPLSLYKKVEICTYFREENTTADQTLLFRTFRNNRSVTLNVPLDSLHKNGWQFNYIKNNPSELTIYVPDKQTGAAFLFDSVYATGHIPAYSLFSGSGDWNDTARWSHLPPLRNRNALIQGKTTISDDMQCHDVAIHSGSIHLSEKNRLSLHDLSFYGDDAFFCSNGTLRQSGRITVYKTFEETGKWYFISFPFDVYTDGVDSRFQQQDERFEGSGNYFYLQQYNSDKRASRNIATGNWEVVPVQTSPLAPLFEKNKGYLIALDKKAAVRTLSFSSRSGRMPDDFAKNGRITVSLKYRQPDTCRTHFGWILCGNPLPAPLLLSQIGDNPTLDGFVYVYDGTTYQPYSIRKNPEYALPPFSAFFLKVSQETEIRVHAQTAPSTYSHLIRTDAPLNTDFAEPLPQTGSTHTEVSPAGEVSIVFRDSRLYIEHLVEPGQLRLFGLTGQCLLDRTLAPGSHALSLAGYIPGIYILQMRTSRHTITRKLYLPGK